MTQTAVLLDLEYTAWEGSVARQWGGPNEHREVVQIGALRVDRASARPLEAFSQFVMPRINPVLSDYFIALTGITNETIRTHGVPFEEAYRAFLDFLKDGPVFSYGRDDKVIGWNIDLYGLESVLPKLTGNDLRPYFADAGVDVPTVNSGHLAEFFGAPLPDEGQEHDALYDCRSIASASAFLIAQGKPSPFTDPEHVVAVRPPHNA